jgi:hypothetical protein
LSLCPYCGLNAFKDNRLRVYDWLNKDKSRKLPDAIRRDVVESVIPPEHVKESKELCIPVIKIRRGKSYGDAV